MAKLCEGRVAIVTGGGGGIGREHALMLAAHGAKVVVNDLGTARDGSGKSTSAAQSVVDEIKKAGGEAVANGDDVSDWNGAKSMVDQAIKTFGKLDAVINNAGILRDRMLVNMSEDEWDAVVRVHLKGTFAPARHAAAYWRDRNKETGQPVNGRIINTSSGSGPLRQCRPNQLRRRQGRHRRILDHRSARARPLRRHRQCHQPARADAHDRGPATA